MKDRDRYLKIVEWSDEDKCYVGSVPGWIGKCCHGDNEEKVYRQLCRIVDEWIDIYKKDGQPLPPSISDKQYSGKFQLRTGCELHKALAIKALQTGNSLNNYCINVLRKEVAPSEKTMD
ncbi:type II toxin-antitoxin system HicB family antitoxin [Desulfosudis oleivorans]|uniref:HicB family protein n=1 Tax=Desulfosudis oleivorans (strain DSM 6200 / JCM 39069 / Hxd3) TaxID=96561 RepID=A8ZTI9_DESOH|nr:toxin-antitoxin system HicB family antitoxin [Desulfosudis oleivorans]ABW66253.1 HicB family protein [Desulfosudis oleivorans Hxd3]